jgi:hypothetical protein
VVASGLEIKRDNQTMKRNLFAEIAEGFDALTKQHVGKVTLRPAELEVMPTPEITAGIRVSSLGPLMLAGASSAQHRSIGSPDLSAQATQHPSA